MSALLPANHMYFKSQNAIDKWQSVAVKVASAPSMDVIRSAVAKIAIEAGIDASAANFCARIVLEHESRVTAVANKPAPVAKQTASVAPVDNSAMIAAVTAAVLAAMGQPVQNSADVKRTARKQAHVSTEGTRS